MTGSRSRLDPDEGGFVTRYEELFGAVKPIIAMVHIGATPGAPLHDAERGIDGLIADARADIDALQAAGVDAVMFGNEHDRPYELDVDVAATATMAYVIGRVRDQLTVPFGVNVLWDPARPWRSPRPPGRPSCARSSPAPTPPTWAPGTPTLARHCGTRGASARTTS